MRRFSILDWSLEQRWMIILLIFLVFYNSNDASLLSKTAHSCDRLPLVDPFYPITFLSSSSFPALVDGILQASFLCILLLFWLSVYHGIRQVSHCRRARLKLILFFEEFSPVSSILHAQDRSRQSPLDLLHCTVVGSHRPRISRPDVQHDH